jgi:hypothetical protein
LDSFVTSCHLFGHLPEGTRWRVLISCVSLPDNVTGTKLPVPFYLVFERWNMCIISKWDPRCMLSLRLTRISQYFIHACWYSTRSVRLLWRIHPIVWAASEQRILRSSWR